jgi:hypothetical protein
LSSTYHNVLYSIRLKRRLRTNLLPWLRHQFTYLPSGYATIFYVQVFGVVEGIRVSSAVYYSPPMQRLVQATNDVIIWHNDIYSFQKVILERMKKNVLGTG